MAESIRNVKQAYYLERRLFMQKTAVFAKIAGNLYTINARLNSRQATNPKSQNRSGISNGSNSF